MLWQERKRSKGSSSSQEQRLGCQEKDAVVASKNCQTNLQECCACGASCLTTPFTSSISSARVDRARISSAACVRVALISCWAGADLHRSGVLSFYKVINPTALLPVDLQSALVPQGEGKHGSSGPEGPLGIWGLGRLGRWACRRGAFALILLGHPSIVLLPGAWSNPAWHLQVRFFRGWKTSLWFCNAK